MKRNLPGGTVTFLFTDVEGSTKLLHAIGAEAYADALAEHRRVLRRAFAAHGGVEVDTQGDAFFVAFPTAPGALAAAAEASDALTAGPIKVRVGIHTGTPYLTDEGYVGTDVHRAARIAATGHGGQILVSAATATLLHEANLRDLGEHRLKDLTTPERIHQFGDDEHPPLRTISNTNLPRPVSSFVGREREVEEIVARLRGTTRLLTLTGPGGTGKTRLAIEAASELVLDNAGGVYWVPLAGLRDAQLVTGEIARIIGANDTLAEAIGEREMLLVLDNAEQVVAAGPELSGLLEACPNLRLIVTSRELLRLRGEEEYPVQPLAGAEAIELFAARANVTDPVVGELCRRLDNLPLAVELAAARARLLSPAQILDRLALRLDLFRGARDSDDRQSTLRATIEWSHDLLSPEEQQLFARLAVFRGGWSIEAAEDVADADLDTLASLVDKSLVARTGERFRMLETIRAYAEERLADGADAEEMRHRHFNHFLRLTEQWYADRSVAEPSWMSQLETENDNIRAALDWAHQASATDEVRLAGAVAPLWALRGQAPEAIRRLKAALPRYAVADEWRARALTHLGEQEDDVARLEEALMLWRTLADPGGEALALEAIGWANDAIGNYEAAQAAHEASIEMRIRARSPEAEGLSARAGLCHVLVVRGETERAQVVAEELLTLAQAHDASLMEELALHFLADCSLLDGDYGEAETRYRRALACAHEAGFVGRATDEVIGIAMSLAAAGHGESALRLAAAAHARQEEIAKTADHWWQSMQDRLLGAARRQIPAARLAGIEAEGSAASFDATVVELIGSSAPAALPPHGRNGD